MSICLAPVLKIGVASLLVAAAVALAASVAGGLSRVGLDLSPFAGHAWLPAATVFHAALMIGGLMGTMIGVEQAVSAKLRWAFAAPVASAFSIPALLIGELGAAAGLLIAAAVGLVVANAFVVFRERTDRAAFSLAAALAWLAGSMLFAAGTGGEATFALWLTFLIVTIAAERVPTHPPQGGGATSQRGLRPTLVVLLVAAASSAIAPAAGGTLYGLALVALAICFSRVEPARHAERKDALRRYIATSSRCSTAWLAIGGVAWAATALGWTFARDAALHALGLGFIVGTMMGHAPGLLRSVAHVDLRFGRFFYVPLAALQLSLVVRVGFGALDPDWRAIGAALNVAALALFIATLLGAAVTGRVNVGAGRGARPAR